jgi:hypothetical protein
MTDDEWQELRRRRLAENTIYIPDTPEYRAMYDDSIKLEVVPENDETPAMTNDSIQGSSVQIKSQEEINLLKLMTGGDK